MATRATIEMEYAKTIRQVKKLETMARSLKGIHNEMQDSLRRLMDGWKSESADAYQRKVMQMSDRIRQDADSLNYTAATLRNIAERTRRAELESIRIAERRKYR